MPLAVGILHHDEQLAKPYLQSMGVNMLVSFWKSEVSGTNSLLIGDNACLEGIWKYGIDWNGLGSQRITHCYTYAESLGDPQLGRSLEVSSF